MSLLNGKVIACRELPYDGRYYLVVNGKKRWIVSHETAESYRIGLSDVVCLNNRLMPRYPIGPSISYCPAQLAHAADATQARTFLCKDVKGVGIEFGPGSHPTALPLDADALYADIYSVDSGANVYYQKGREEYVPITYPTGINEMNGIEDNSADFIIGCHVIEHSTDPIGAILKCYEKLKPGGMMLLAVPHKEYTFDKTRALTALPHLIEDHARPCIERDMLHFVDAFENTGFMMEYSDEKKIYATIRQMLDGALKVDVHYHTFTEDNFMEMMEYTGGLINKRHGTGWAKAELFERVPFPGSIEFYVRAFK